MIGLLRIPLNFVILLYQSLTLALSQVWANKMRSILTTIGIMIGVASVSAVIAALSGLTTYVLNNFEALGTNKVFIYPMFPSGANRSAFRGRILFSPSDFDGMLEHCPSLRAYTRLCQGQFDVRYKGKSDDGVQVVGIDPDWLMVENRTLVLGRPFSVIDVEHARPVCMINTALQKKLALPKDCSGYSIVIGEQRYRIVGVLDMMAANMFEGGSETDSEVYVPFTTLYTVLAGRAFIYVNAASRSPNLSEEAKGEITFFLRQRRRIHPGEGDTFMVRFMSEFVDNFKKVAGVMTDVAAGIVCISLLVGGVGITNIMLVSVSERTREIGLRKAVGARPSAILLQFLVEAIFLCCLGGLVGLGIGELMTLGMAQLTQWDLQNAYIPGWAIALSFGFSATVGLIFGIVPAIKAARLDPIEALRHE